MADPQRIITVFGSGRVRAGEPEYEQALRLGRALAGRGFAVCSGGYGGVMEAALRGAKQAGGRTLAVTARFFRARVNEWVDEEHAVSGWEDRLFELIRRGYGYVACKGGTGTLVELAMVWEMLNKGVIARKPFVVVGDFWTPVLERVREVERDDGSRWGEAERGLVRVVPSPDEAAEVLTRELAREER